MFEHPDPARPDSWRVQRTLKLRQMASDLRTHASRRRPGVANTMRQTAVDLDRPANRLEDIISRPA